MNRLLVQLKINENLYLKDPQSSTLGKNIIQSSVDLIDEIGMEKFTFKKLAERLHSTETSVYRYFENKHQLFVYLLNWYWEWMITRIDLNLMYVQDARRKLEIALDIIVDTANRNMEIEFVDEEKLHKIVVREGAKAYHHIMIDEDNQEGFFLAYKRLCNRIAEIITEIQPDFPYPRALASTLLETANNNLYFARHLPRLTDLKVTGDTNLNSKVKKMLLFFCSNLIHSSNENADNDEND